MTIEGVVVRLLEPISGTSARGEWKKQEVIIQQPGEFGRQVCVSFWSEKADEAATLKEGEQVAIDVNVSSREYNERWYTDVQAWKMTRGAAQPPMPEAPSFGAPQPQSHGGNAQGNNQGFSAKDQAGEKEFDDLPF